MASEQIFVKEGQTVNAEDTFSLKRVSMLDMIVDFRSWYYALDLEVLL